MPKYDQVIKYQEYVQKFLATLYLNSKDTSEIDKVFYQNLMDFFSFETTEDPSKINLKPNEKQKESIETG
ncbi:hypothetical protein ATX28_09210 [Oenococcus oeni]|uniref:hypothetical protein n=1 Tax=Oenococcus oeni TaxID=1247 RepID=UPI000952BA49|nr:hypothetical protein [Oenococcus oeni]OLQ38383.1 hypothetical protein ATX28_09210 [Oenococcus oeni]